MSHRGERVIEPGRVGGDLSEVAVYRRTIGASLERVWENVLDWEHLPWLHRTSFLDVRLLDADREGWRARVVLPPRAAPQEAEIDVRLDRPRLRYLARTTAGAGAGTEILTRLDPSAARTTGITVSFRVPGVTASDAAAIGAAYVHVYTQLWNEDEAMMCRRQALLDGVADPALDATRAADAVRLGPGARLRARLPVVIQAHGRSVRLVEIDGEIVAHGTVCPHLGGPLDEAPIEDGCVRCPWHGYRFDVRSGRNADGRACRLAPAHAVAIDPTSGEAWLLAPAATVLSTPNGGATAVPGAPTE
jgi:nitrite reductase/ring-hydroxylating ferredoxin subunit